MDTEVSRTMNFTLLRHTRLYDVAVLLTLVLTLVGCAVSPQKSPASRAEDDKRKVTAPEKGVTVPRKNVELDADAIADFDAAMKHLNAGEYEKGTDLLKKVTQRAPEHTVSYINLAMAYQKMDKLEAAEESIKKALELEPEHPVANTEYGVILRKAGKFTEAREVYERTLTRYPAFLPARKNLGILCDIYLRDLECALTHYRLYSVAVPDNEEVKIWIADLERRVQ
jgi:Tfp pilus assembly protein PilF